jgi:dTDP-4-amino-4,6-dideoxygalactose transaminase
MHFIDLAKQQSRIRDTIQNNIDTVLAHGKYIMGPEVQALEERLAEYVGVKHAVGCASGTDALSSALMAYRKSDFPASEDYASRIFSLPMHPYLAEEEQARIAAVME